MPLVITSNVDTERGLSNGTQVKLINFTEDYLVIFNHKINKKQFLAKMTFIQEINDKRLERYFWPVVPGFAMTVWKTQGLTLKNIFLMLNKYS